MNIVASFDVAKFIIGEKTVRPCHYVAAFKKSVWLHFMSTRVLDLFVVLFTVVKLAKKEFMMKEHLKLLGHQFNCNSMKLFIDNCKVLLCFRA